MNLNDFIRAMPKVELHVHLEGAIRPAVLRTLAHCNQVDLPASSLERLSGWHRFDDFRQFVDLYLKVSECIRTPVDLEVATRAFLLDQAAQHIAYSEVTYTPYTHFKQKGLPFDEQLEAINRARAWAEAELHVTMGLVVDISRHVSPEEGCLIAAWAISGLGKGVVALGLGGPEIGNRAAKFAEAFALARQAGLPAVPHAGEMVGPESIREALEALHAARIGHGVRCLEDPALVADLRQRQVPLEVCPTSNVCLNVVPGMAEHPLPQLLQAGLCVTLNTDDPALFGTTLTQEFMRWCGPVRQGRFEFGTRRRLDPVGGIVGDAAVIEGLVLNAVNASFLEPEAKARLRSRFVKQFARLRAELDADLGYEVQVTPPFQHQTND